MYVCLCNGYTDKQIAEAVGSGAESVAKVYRCLGRSPRCAKCVPYVRGVLEQQQSVPDPALDPSSRP